MRYVLTLVCAVEVVLAVAFFLQLPFAVSLWPFPGTTPLTFILLSSFAAAAAASTIWVLASENYGALAGIGLDYVAILAPVSILALQVGASTSQPQFTRFGIVCVLTALFGAWLLWWSSSIPIDRTRPMPGFVRFAFVVFIVVLVIVSALLILKVPNVIPWTITPELSILVGWMFFGAAAYFAYGLLRPSWANAAGQLAGFLAYDAVLIMPLLTRLPTAALEHRIGLIVYIAVVVFSAMVAVYYLFIHKPTRSRSPLLSGRA
jgi:hypothetical protein